ncbi:DUF6010 family protein [Thalassotalea mangrovi]|uniref:Uncharacterized protein n=1 Tax=Thalassotalea mangrovi TaxID=2572245 RepID=A0A4V5NTV5_9GAMM|nr:DUF6010 family protein [Thalassotalea mangrovi]TKB43139.1 hypothetical protein E8M12_15780 [Thalassotalea mangrovi]
MATTRNRIWLALGWLLHPVWDIGLHLQGPGWHIVPPWYAVACVSFDILVAIYIVWRIRNQPLHLTATKLS